MFRVPVLSVGLLCRLRLLCLLASTSDIPATSGPLLPFPPCLSLVLCVSLYDASGLSHSPRPVFSLPASFLLCSGRLVSAVGQSVMSVTFLLPPSTQVRLLPRLRLLGPVFSAVLLLVYVCYSLCFLACVFSMSLLCKVLLDVVKSAMSVTLVVLLR